MIVHRRRVGGRSPRSLAAALPQGQRRLLALREHLLVQSALAPNSPVNTDARASAAHCYDSKARAGYWER
jgi:hypothetical protein